MKDSRRNLFLKTLLVLSSLFLLRPPSCLSSNYDQWDETERKVSQAVIEHGLSQTLASLPPEPDKETAAMLWRFSLYVRSGNEQGALRIMNSLAHVQGTLDYWNLSRMADFLIDRRLSKLSRSFLTLFPQATPGWGYVFIREWAGEHPSKETITEIDHWLEAQYLARLKQPLPMSEGQCGVLPGHEGGDYWLFQRLDFLKKYSSVQPVLEKLANDVRARPSELACLRRYITAEQEYGTKSSIAWLVETAKPKTAFNAYRLAECLHRNHPTQAIEFLKSSLAMKFTEEDAMAMKQLLRSCSQAPHLFVTPEKTLRDWTRSMLAECYQATGDSTSAQKLLVELAKSSTGLPSYALTEFAGQVQASTPVKPLEGMIKQAEQDNKNSPEYWRGRAEYYSGRGDDRSALNAYKNYMDLTKLGQHPDQAGVYSRCRAVSSYGAYLRRTGKADQALALVWREFDENGDIDYRKRLVLVLSNWETKLLSAAENRLWWLLAAEPKWDLSDEQILRAMIMQIPKAQQEQYWSRAEKLTQDADPSRSRVLGWIMTRSERSGRAIPFLKIASAKLPPGDEKRSAFFTLFEAYLDVNDWKNAEAVWPEALKHLTPGELADWMGRLSLCAARAGSKSDAIRLWKRKDDLDRTVLSHLYELATTGLRNELIQYYNALAASNGDATYIIAARKILSSSAKEK